MAFGIRFNELLILDLVAVCHTVCGGNFLCITELLSFLNRAADFIILTVTGKSCQVNHFRYCLYYRKTRKQNILKIIVGNSIPITIRSNYVVTN